MHSAPPSIGLCVIKSDCSLNECALALCMRKHYWLGLCASHGFIWQLQWIRMYNQGLSLPIFIPTLWFLTFQLQTHDGFCSLRITHLTLCNLTQTPVLSWKEICGGSCLRKKNNGTMCLRRAAFEWLSSFSILLYDPDFKFMIALNKKNVLFLSSA